MQDPAPHVMVFMPHTRVFTIPRQSATERGPEAGWEDEAEEIEAAGMERGRERGREGGREGGREEGGNEEGGREGGRGCV